jgi:hypothetical protein
MMKLFFLQAGRSRAAMSGDCLPKVDYSNTVPLIAMIRSDGGNHYIIDT